MTYDLKKTEFDREHIYIVELDLDYCSLTFGQSPCTAGTKSIRINNITNDSFNVGDTLTGNITSATGTIRSVTAISGGYLITYTPTSGTFQDGEAIFSSSGGIAEVNGAPFDTEKCFNTFASTQDAPNYTKTIKTYRFCEERSPHPIAINQGGDNPDTIPCLESVSIAPSEIDLSGGLGVRSSVTCRFKDFPHSDINIDKYIDDRTYIASDRGTFWTKLRARNPNYQFRNMRVLSGYLNSDGSYDVDNFQQRHYVIERLDVTNGQATVVGKDPLKLASRKKAQAPEPSTGQLQAGITAASGSGTLIPAGVGDAEYPASGKILINSEVISFTRSGDALTFTQRGDNNTTATAHSANDTVQLCLEYSGQQVYEIVEDLLVNYADIDSSFIPTSSWEAEDDAFLNGLLTGIVVKPFDVWKLLKELAEAAPHYLWWDEREQLIQFTALKGPPDDADVLDMDANLVMDSFRTSDKPDMRISTVVVNFGQFDPTKKIDEFSNYQQSYVRVDTDSITQNQANQIKTINSRWITNTNKAAAIVAAALIGRRFSNIPRAVSFSLDAKDSDLWVGQAREINHRDIVDFTGLPENTLIQITSAKESQNYDYRALEFKYGDELPDDEGGGDPTVDLIIISLDDRNINLRSIYDGLFPTPDASTKAKFIVENGVIIGSDSAATPAIDTGSWPAGATVTLQQKSSSFVVGKGGAGGGSAGGAGGLGILMNYDLEIINGGVIGGGGGGGGGADDSGGGSTGNAGGGGGAGDSPGLGGPSSIFPGDGRPSLITNATNGTLENGGIKGVAESDTLNILAAGGDGGDLGQAGQAGTQGSTTYAGGAAGDAIDKNGFVLTQTEAGDIRGAIIP